MSTTAWESSRHTVASTRLGQGQRVEHRILGVGVGLQDDEFGLGDDVYDREATIQYILQTKMQSPDPADRSWFIDTLWKPERYPGQRAEVEALLNDPDASVREVARKQLRIVGD